MPIATPYRNYARECLNLARTATPVHRAHLLRVAKVWLAVAAQTENEMESLDKAETSDEPK